MDLAICSDNFQKIYFSKLLTTTFWVNHYVLPPKAEIHGILSTSTWVATQTTLNASAVKSKIAQSFVTARDEVIVTLRSDSVAEYFLPRPKIFAWPQHRISCTITQVFRNGYLQTTSPSRRVKSHPRWRKSSKRNNQMLYRTEFRTKSTKSKQLPNKWFSQAIQTVCEYSYCFEIERQIRDSVFELLDDPAGLTVFKQKCW